MRAERWPRLVHRALAAAQVRVVGYVPDAGLKELIRLCHADSAMRAVPLTTEQDGIGLAAGAWLGGKRSALLLQSSGVGNLVNALGMVTLCRLPLVMIVTMRGERGEFNPWQVPMGRAVPAVLEAMGVSVRRSLKAREVSSQVRQALRSAYEKCSAEAVLVSQHVIGIKSFQEQAAR